MKRSLFAGVLLASLALAKTFTLEQVLSAPFPSELIAAPGGGKVAWLLNERGARNVWMAAAPDFKGARLTNYTRDDGQDVGQLRWTPDGKAVIYVRGGDLEFLGRPDPNPMADPAGALTALGLARASSLFAAGVDFHGVHDWSTRLTANTDAARTALESSPMASVRTWRSPVLLIHGDDDRNVNFSETITLANALRQQGVYFEQLILPDEIHGFLRHASWLRGYHAAADFPRRKL
jgi:dipeptidyl aminopeptidase/acylaminoacyl peptidase